MGTPTTQQLSLSTQTTSNPVSEVKGDLKLWSEGLYTENISTKLSDTEMAPLPPFQCDKTDQSESSLLVGLTGDLGLNDRERASNESVSFNTEPMDTEFTWTSDTVNDMLSAQFARESVETHSSSLQEVDTLDGAALQEAPIPAAPFSGPSSDSQFFTAQKRKMKELREEILKAALDRRQRAENGALALSKTNENQSHSDIQACSDNDAYRRARPSLNVAVCIAPRRSNAKRRERKIIWNHLFNNASMHGLYHLTFDPRKESLRQGLVYCQVQLTNSETKPQRFLWRWGKFTVRTSYNISFYNAQQPLYYNLLVIKNAFLIEEFWVI